MIMIIMRNTMIITIITMLNTFFSTLNSLIKVVLYNTQPNFQHLGTVPLRSGFSLDMLLEIPRMLYPTVWNLPFAVGPSLSYPDLTSLYVPILTYLTNGMYSICGLLSVIVKSIPPHIVDNILKTHISQGNMGNLYNNFIYLKDSSCCSSSSSSSSCSSSSILVKEHLIPGLESLKYIMTHLTVDLKFTDVIVLKVVMFKIIIFDVFNLLYRPVLSASSFTPINKAKNASDLSVPNPKEVSNVTNNKRKDRSPNRAGVNPEPVTTAKRQRKAQEITINVQYLNLQNNTSVLIYDTLDLTCTNLSLLYQNVNFRPVVAYNHNGVNIRCIRFGHTNFTSHNPTYANVYTELIHNGFIGVWIHPKYGEEIRRYLNFNVTNNGLPLITSGRRIFVKR